MNTSNLADTFQPLPSSTIYRLQHLALLVVSGTQAYDFLQGQLAIDLAHANQQLLPLSFCCSRQGRLVALFHYLSFQQQHGLLVHRSLAEVLRKRLQKYRLNEDVAITIETPTVWDLPLSHSLEHNTAIAIPQWSRKLCIDFDHRLSDQLQAQENSEWHWHKQLIYQGLPLFTRDMANRFLPHELKLDRFKLIHLDKGCYLGQEIIARMHYLGKSKYTLLLWQHSSPLAPGDAFHFEQAAIGTVVDCLKSQDHNHCLLLGLIKNDKVPLLAPVTLGSY